MNQSLPTSLRETIADTLEIAPEQVSPALKASDTESWDSFRHLQLMLAIEGEYGVQFDPGQIPELTSVSSILSALQAKGVELA